MKIQISPTTILNIEIEEVFPVEDHIFDEFDYKKAMEELFNSIFGELCLISINELKNLCVSDVKKSEESLEKITKKFIQFKTKEEQRRDEISRKIIETTKSF